MINIYYLLTLVIVFLIISMVFLFFNKKYFLSIIVFLGLSILFLFLTDKIIITSSLKKYCGRYTKVEICPDKIVMEYISEDGDRSNCYSKSGFKIIGNCNKDNCLSPTNICEK